ncbi:MAG: PilN domain-containing protein [Desulfobacterota bacterium]|nr:PilN domain-containing protein [Thermodesulfobacteriota bacterium]MDW8002160.1 PilN domain-containing protein [Deltaproteobacteria bacterium]
MIRINLLPVPEKRPTTIIDLQIFSFLLFLGLVIVGILLYSTNKRISELSSRIEETKKRIESLDSVYKEYITMEREKKEIQKRLTIVQTIKKGRALPARIMYDISGIVKETIWLRSIKKVDAQIVIEGRSIESESVADFMEQFSKLPYVRNVELLSVEETVEEGLPVKKFILQGEITL